MAHEGNYCRNPDSSESPWCYVQGNTKHVKEKCTIPSCGKLYSVIKLLTDKFKASLEFHWKIRNENLKKCMFRNKTILNFDFFCSAKSPCFQNPCKNHGKCTVNDTSFTCTCLNGFKGDNCEILGTL